MTRAATPWLRQGVLALLAWFSAGALAHPTLEGQVDHLSDHLDATPSDAQGWVRRGELHRRQQDYHQARHDLQQARALSPGDPTLDWLEGRLALEAGDAHEADLLLSRYVDRDPAHPGAWFAWAQARQLLGDPANAAEGFQLALVLSTAPSPGLYREAALAWHAVEAQAPGRALMTVDEGLARFGNEVVLLGVGADIALATNQPERARSYLDRVPARLQPLPQWSDRIAQLADLEPAAN